MVFHMCRTKLLEARRMRGVRYVYSETEREEGSVLSNVRVRTSCHLVLAAANAVPLTLAYM